MSGGTVEDGRGRVRYRFPPLERRGVIAGWRGGQIGAVAGALVVAVAVARARPSAGGVLVAVTVVAGGVALATWPVAGRTGEQWLPLLVRWAWAGRSGDRRQLGAGPGHGRLVALDGEGRLRVGDPGRDRHGSGALAGLSVGAAPLEGTGAAMGVVHDQRARTATAVLALSGHSFALLGPTDQDARVAAWAQVLASLARDGSAVHRVQWLETCRPDDGSAVRRWLDGHAVLGDGAPAVRSYRDLLTEAGPVTRRHRVLLAVTVHRARSARAVRAAGGGAAGLGAVLAREVAAVHRSLEGADVEAEGVLGPAALAHVLADGLGTAAAGEPAATRDGADDRGPAAGPWPLALEPTWDAVRCEAAWHAVYWVAEWPRVDVTPDFLGPVLLAPLRRTLAVVMEPVDPVRAARQVAQARTADLADGELRRRGGFLTTARHARERQSVEHRDLELADGHAQFRFTGYVGVTAGDRPGLDAACTALEQGAAQARLEVRRLWGQQDAALVCTLPLGRGLA